MGPTAFTLSIRAALSGLAMLAASPALAQERDPADRSDPSVVERDLREREVPANRTTEGRIQAPRSAPVAAAGGEVTVSAIRVIGAREIPTEAFQGIVARYVGRRLGHPELSRLATEVAGVARARGYGLATAWVPAQDVGDGVLVVEVEEGRIDAVRASGAGAALAERLLASVAGGGPVRTAELERRLLLAGDVPGLWVGDARLVREGSRNILAVNTRFERTAAEAEIDNWGSETVGRVRARLGLTINSALTSGDSLSIGGALTPLEPRELQLVDGRYRLPIGRAGTEIGVGGYLAHTRSGAWLRDRDLEGDSSEVQINLTHPLQRTRAASHWLGARFSVRDSQLAERGVLLRDDRIVSSTSSLFSNLRFAGGRLRSRLALVQGLDLFDATERGDPNASRTNAGGVFTKFEYWMDYHRPLGRGLSIELASRGQIANRPLLSSEEIGLGGRQFLRAFDYREASGDQGAAASAELRLDIRDTPQAVRKAQVYAYLDGGRVHDLRSTRQPRGLASAGMGLRIHLRGGFEAGAELGVPLTDGVFDANPDPRFSFTLGARF